MKKNAGYIIKHDDKAIMLTKAYAKQSSVPGTKEFRELAKLHKTFPDYTRPTASILHWFKGCCNIVPPPPPKGTLKLSHRRSNRQFRATLI